MPRPKKAGPAEELERVRGLYRALLAAHEHLAQELDAERAEKDRLLEILEHRHAWRVARRAGRASGTAKGRAAKEHRAAAVDEHLAAEARAMKRRNPTLSNAMIGHHMTRDGGKRVLVAGLDEPVVVERIGPKRVARWLASG